MTEKELVQMDSNTIMKLVAGGDTASLSPEQKLQYYRARCDAAGIDARTAPFQFIRLQGREVLYATKGATDQLAANHGVKVEILSQATESGVRTVVVRAIAKDGRQTDEIGVVPVENVRGADLANAYMKAVSKAKRRAILSICGLGMLDESEIETISGVAPAPVQATPEGIKPVANALPHPQSADNIKQPDKKITVPQAKRFFAIAKSADKTDADIKAYLQNTLGIERSADMNLSDYEKAVEWAQTVGDAQEVVNEETGEVSPA